MIDIVNELRAQSINRPVPRDYVADLHARAASEIAYLRAVVEAYAEIADPTPGVLRKRLKELAATREEPKT